MRWLWMPIRIDTYWYDVDAYQYDDRYISIRIRLTSYEHPATHLAQRIPQTYRHDVLYDRTSATQDPYTFEMCPLCIDAYRLCIDALGAIPSAYRSCNDSVSAPHRLLIDIVSIMYRLRVDTTYGNPRSVRRKLR